MRVFRTKEETLVQQHVPCQPQLMCPNLRELLSSGLKVMYFPSDVTFKTELNISPRLQKHIDKSKIVIKGKLKIFIIQ